MVAVRRLRGALVAGVLASTLLAAAPATAATLATTPTPLPGSTFQGGDGNQDDAAPYVDWESMGNRVVHSPDPNDEDTAFGGGSEEGRPFEWRLTTASGGVSPPKDNVLDAWSVVDQPDASTFLYLAFTRAAATGTTFLTYELNRDTRLWTNDRGARIPCRRTGDVLLSFEQSGSDMTVVVNRWVTDSTDDTSSCARTGRLERFASVSSDVAQGAVNTGGIASHLPGLLTGTIEAGQFGEVALNLAKLLNRAFKDDCLAFDSVWMHSRASDSETSALKDYVAPQPLAVRTCSASGTKFFDSNANGRRDAGEIGIPRFMIWADYDGDGRRESNEPYTVTDARGAYVLHDIRPPDGRYMLRETLLTRRSPTIPVATDWQCSYPNDATDGGTGSAPDGRFPCAWGPIDVHTTPNATGRDFGNWFPARLTLRKEIEPETDPGRFDLLVNGQTIVPSAGDGARETISVPPGTYTVSEVAVPPTNPLVYTATVRCRRTVTHRGAVRTGTVFAGLQLSAGQRATCTFRNTRNDGPRPVPAIEIVKTGPGVVTAGETLRYTFYVSNPGQVPFAEDEVTVTDEACDAAPQLGERPDDPSPETLDPGDTWTYTCSHATTAREDCEPSRFPNTATASGSARGATVDDSDSIDTIILCPDRPKPPTPVPPGPAPSPQESQSGAVVPPGPTPPPAGVAARARGVFSQTIRGCIRSRVPRVSLRGTYVDTLRVFINGRLRRDLTVRTLRSVIRPRVTLPPGRHRIRVNVTFDPGVATPPLTLTGSFRICAAAAPSPSFTG